MNRTIIAATVATASLFACSVALAQATVKPDGQWRAALGAGASVVSGNSKASSLNLSGDAVRASAADKWSLYGTALQGRSNGVTTAEFFKLGSRYDRNIDDRWFGFGIVDFEHNKPANLSLRSALGAGAGYHVVKSEALTFDVFGGVGYALDNYKTSLEVLGRSRDSYGRAELLLGEESSHKLTPTTSFKQRLLLYPNLTDSGAYRATFDAGLSVAMSSTMSLTVSLGERYNSDPGTGLKKSDTVLFTGISVKYD